MKRVLITGATSMIGVDTIRCCLEHDMEVFAIVRPQSSKLSRLPNNPRLKIIECDLENVDSLKLSARQFDCVFHLGWRRVDRNNPNDLRIQLQNIEDTLKVIDLANRVNCKTFVGAGTLLEYGRIHEIARPGLYVIPNNIYAAAKYSAGIMSRVVCRQKGIRHIWTRIFGVYGIYDDERTIMNYAISNMLNNEECNFSLCEQIWDYIYSKDCAEAFYKIASFGKENAIYNIGTGKERKLSSYIEEIRELTQSKSKINYGAIAYADLQAMYYVADITDISTDTGWNPTTSFAEGVSEIIRYKLGRNENAGGGGTL